MTDPNAPDGAQPPAQTPPPAAPEPSFTQPPAYAQAPQPPAYPQASQQPGYAPAPPAPYGAPVPTRPGRTLGIVAFVLSFFIQLVALILGIVALVQSRKAGEKNGFALAAIIISAALIVLGIIIAIIVGIAVGAGFAEFCSQNGPGVHQLTSGGSITCS